MLTNDQINRAIAKQRGQVSVYTGEPLRIAYCSDGMHGGLLLEDLFGVSTRITLTEHRGGKYEVWPELRQVAGHGADLLEAVSRAYHAAFCKEK